MKKLAPFFTHMMRRGEPQQESIFGNVTINIEEKLEGILGRAGRMVSSSKSDYNQSHPDHEVFFNACIFTEGGTQVWFGDIDLTRDSDLVQEAATTIGQKLFVTPENPFRWKGLQTGLEEEKRDAKSLKREPRFRIFEP